MRILNVMIFVAAAVAILAGKAVWLNNSIPQSAYFQLVAVGAGVMASAVVIEWTMFQRTQNNTRRGFPVLEDQR